MSQECTVPLHIRISLGTPVPKATAAAALAVGKTRALATGRTTRDAAESTESARDSYLDKFSISSLTSRDFDWHAALSLALAARLAYANEEEVRRVTRGWGLGSCSFFDFDDTQCFLASSQHAVVVSFRGTENLGDWMSNLNVIGTTQSYGRVHRGFLGAFKVVEQQLLGELANHPGKKVLLTGHSLGGALALIAAAEWSDSIRPSWIHTFGQPAVGKKSFKDFLTARYDEKYYRFVNDQDVVPMIPPLYRHAGELIHYSEDGSLENALGSEELESLGIDFGTVNADTPMMTEAEFDQLRARLLLARSQQGGANLDKESVEQAVLESAGEEGVEGFLPSVSDHSMDLYVAKTARHAGF
ncbi:lipase family protein [Luteolibacter flavescens]|uniref:Lipase family protein n=1 Tax=Luteolibacter flavescens TaxID=1859460 RepID=A0ABT3FTY3_9BACT|nr:lipase family protein [Luteolibacter flavescens]MCW1887018.1 lipase family protein [Luteolibacter flavescens]